MCFGVDKIVAEAPGLISRLKDIVDIINLTIIFHQTISYCYYSTYLTIGDLITASVVISHHLCNCGIRDIEFFDTIGANLLGKRPGFVVSVGDRGNIASTNAITRGAKDTVVGRIIDGDDFFVRNVLDLFGFW